MKKVILSIVLISACLGVKAQNTFPVTGNVGIGTTTPDAKLVVNGGINITHAKFIGTRFGPQGIQVERSGGANIRLVANYASFGGGLESSSALRFSVNGDGVDSPSFYVKTDGNVGIGTTNPAAKFHVDNGDNSYGSILANASEKSFSLYTKTLNTNINSESFRLGLKHDTNENNGYISFFRGNHAGGGFLGFSTNGAERIRVDQSGNVGIGTTTPGSKLTVIGQGSGNANSFNNSTLRVDNLIMGTDYTDNHLYIQSHGSKPLYVNELGNNVILGLSTGKVGIGTTNPDSKLAVNGKIHAKEVKVDLVGWSDFVLKKTYKLPMLVEVEKHIKEKGHLKDIPSEKEVLKNGILLGEMNAKLLQKIEELTLYAIAQEKKLKKKDEELKILSERMTVIEKLLKSK